MTEQQGQDNLSGNGGGRPLGVIERLMKPPPKPRPGEKCDMCNAKLPDGYPGHSHIVNLDTRQLLCTCRACYLLFTQQGAGGGKYRPVPDRYRAITDFNFSRAQWESLQIPVSVAFIFFNSTLGHMVAFYPSPAGATESLLPIDTWQEVMEANPDLSTLTPDVEALLVRSTRDVYECFIVPIDTCYELVGHLRRLWRGFDGGSEARNKMEEFFTGVRQRAGVSEPEPAAQDDGSKNEAAGQ